MNNSKFNRITNYSANITIQLEREQFWITQPFTIHNTDGGRAFVCFFGVIAKLSLDIGLSLGVCVHSTHMHGITERIHLMGLPILYHF